MKRAAIFPGQGAQFPGMGRDLAEKYPEARELFARADETLGFPLSRTCFSGSAEEIDRTDVCQPGIFLVSAAVMTVLAQRRKLEQADFMAAAGLSLGEYTALWFAGSLDFEDALRLTRARGELMQAASDAEPSGMSGVMGLELDAIERICAEVRAEGGVVCVANLNSPGQVVISGAKAALAHAAELLSAAGARRIVPLPVAGAFHSPLMAPAAEGLRLKLAEADVKPARIPVVANSSAMPVSDPEEIRESLVHQLTRPVLWARSMQSLIGDGYTEFVEPGPGTVLAGLMKRIDRSAVVRGFPDAASIEATDAAAPPAGGEG